MIAIVIILLVTGYTVAHFYLKFAPMTAFATLMASVFGSIVAFNYYQTVANIFIARGFGGPWASGGSFLLLFAFAFALIRVPLDKIVGSNIDFGGNIKIAVALILGVVTGLLISGHILVAMGLLPMQTSWAYNRFPGESISPNSPKKALLNPDGMVSGLFSIVSRGSLSSSRSFAVVAADFVNRNHLNRWGISKGASTLTSSNALSVPGGSNKAVRTMEIPELGAVTVVRAQLSMQDIKDGGTADGSGTNAFAFAQVRMITKTADKAGSLRGKGSPLFPIGILQGGKVVKKSLSDVIALSYEMQNEDRNVWMDFVFSVPAGQQGVLLEFKANAAVELPAPVVSNDEIEKALGSVKEISIEQPAETPAAAY